VRAIGDRIAKGADHNGVGGRHDVGRVDKEPRGCGELIGEDVEVGGVVAAARRGDEGGLVGPAVEGHGATIAGNRIGDGEVPTVQVGIVAIAIDPWEPGGVAPDFLADGDGYRAAAAEGHPRHRAVDDIARIFLQAYGDGAEGHGLTAEGVEEAEAHGVAQRSGLMIERKVWLLAVAPVVAASGKGKTKSGWMLAGAKVVGAPGGSTGTGGAV